MKPVLPQDAKHAQKRAEGLAKARESYQYSYEWPPGVATGAKLHVPDYFSVPYVAKVGELDLTMEANHGAMDVERLTEHAEGASRKLFANMKPGNLAKHFFNSATGAIDRFPKQIPETLEHYERFYKIIKAPPIVGAMNDRPDDWDRQFAWQRLAGVNPMVVHRIDRLPDHFPVTDQDFQVTMGPEDSLAGAAAEGRLYLCDYAVLDGAPGGVVKGRQKYCSAPIALFAQRRSGGFYPVAIQVHQKPGPRDPIFTPRDGWRWRMATMAVQVADANHHEAIAHLGQTHLIMEAINMAMVRHLAPIHPLRILMGPHMEFTFAINHTAKGNLIAPGGLVDQIMACPIEVTVAAVKAGIQSFVLQDAPPPKALAARGLDDTSALPVCPYRDDSLRVWAAVRDWVDDYVRLYYETDQDVIADTEVRGWVSELGSQDGGRLPGIRPVNTVDQLIELVAISIYTGSAQHAAVNFPQFPFMGFVVNMPGASWAPMVNADTPNTEDAFRQMLPPWDMTVAAQDAVYQLSGLRDNYLGKYGLLHFHDRRVGVLLKTFQNDLKEIEAAIEKDNLNRLLPYPFLLPSTIPNSIHI